MLWNSEHALGVKENLESSKEFVWNLVVHGGRYRRMQAEI